MKWIWLFQNEINIIGVIAKKKSSSVLIDKLNFCVNAFIMLAFIMFGYEVPVTNTCRQGHFFFLSISRFILAITSQGI